jgi:hypothetical protein
MKSGFQRSRQVVARLILFTLESGLLCAGFAIVVTVTFIVFSDNNIQIILCAFSLRTCAAVSDTHTGRTPSCSALILAKLYSNSTLALLNSRASFVGGRSNPSLSNHVFPERSYELSTNTARNLGSVSAGPRKQPAVNVEISREQYQEDDSLSLKGGHNSIDMPR